MPGEVEVEVEKPKEEVSADKEKVTTPASKSVVGIIYPPPEVRNIVDKTADFVARNGLEFEDRIRINEAGNTKFNFLKPNDPYHAYYRHKITEIQEGVAQEAAAAASQQAQPVVKQAPLTIISEPEPPKEPPPELEFIAEPPSISSMELDIVKLTAQFVARNGAHFLDKLMVREQRNYQFDFLRKQHPLFTYFTKLVEQYSKILMPPHARLHQLGRELENPYLVLDRVQQRVEWTQYEERQRRKVEEKEEKERVEYSQVDWHEFVLVETITFRESESGYLPPPIRPTQLAHRLLQQQKFERVTDEGGEVEEIEMEVEETVDNAEKESKDERDGSPPPPRPPSPPPPPPPSQPTSVQIRRDYNPKSMGPPPQVAPPHQFLISPITGERIPADKIEEHMRFGLLDPRWIENQRRQLQKRKNEEAYSEGVQVQDSLKNLAERRTDIFGVEETLIGQKIGEERKKPSKQAVQWDGYSATAGSVSRVAQSHITAAQIEAHQKSQGLIPDPDKDKIGPAVTTSKPHLPLPTPPMSSPHRSQPLPHQIQSPPIQQQMQQRPPFTMGHRMEMQQTRPLFSSPPSAPMSGHPGGNRLPPPQMGFRQPGPRGPTMPPRQLPGHMFQPGPANSPGMAPRPLLNPPVGGLQAFPPVNIAPDINTDMAPPMMKKVRSEAEDLVPEQQFIAEHPGPVTFRVQVPNLHDRPEWKMSGQLITMTLPVTDPVSVIKAKISTEFGMPSGKQKLQIGNIFIKDSNSLAFYNITGTSVVQLGLKERGGRKR